LNFVLKITLDRSTPATSPILAVINKKLAGHNSPRIAAAIKAPTPEPNKKIETGIKKPNAQRPYFGSFRNIWIPITNMVPIKQPRSAKISEGQSIGGCAALAETRAKGPNTRPKTNAAMFTNIGFIFTLTLKLSRSDQLSAEEQG